MRSFEGNQNEKEMPTSPEVLPGAEHENGHSVDDANSASSDLKGEISSALNTLVKSYGQDVLVATADEIRDDQFHDDDSMTLGLKRRSSSEKDEVVNDKISSSNEEDPVPGLSEKISLMAFPSHKKIASNDDQRDSLESVSERQSHQSITFQDEAFGELLGNDQNELSPIVCRVESDESIHVLDVWAGDNVVESPIRKCVVTQNYGEKNTETTDEDDMSERELSNSHEGHSKDQCLQSPKAAGPKDLAQEQVPSELPQRAETVPNGDENIEKDDLFCSPVLALNRISYTSDTMQMHSSPEANTMGQSESNNGESNEKDRPFSSPDLTSSRISSTSDNMQIFSPLALEKNASKENRIDQSEPTSNNSHKDEKEDPLASPGLTSNHISPKPDNMRTLSPLKVMPGDNSANQPKLDQRDRDLSSAKKKLDASSVLLIERLRGAAQRRNLQVTRSRDSLAAKEKRQLLTNAESKKQMPILPEEDSTMPHPKISSDSRQKQSEGSDLHKCFKARPLPATTGDEGAGGLVGVPKVEKRQATTPFSPQLGPRRRGKERIKALDPPPKKRHPYSSCRESLIKIRSASEKMRTPTQNDPYIPFKALPMPKSTCATCHGGQAGIPKISKRSVTIASSPQLGPRRKQQVKIGLCESDRLSMPLPLRQKPVQTPVLFNPPKGLLSGSEASRAKERNLMERRKREELEAQKKRQFRARSVPKYSSSSPSNSSDASSVNLLGLNLLNNGDSPQILIRQSLGSSSLSLGLENIPPPSSNNKNVSTTNTQKARKHRHSLPYQPHSTKRAGERAKFDSRQVERKKEVSKERQKLRQSLMKIRAEEIKILRQKI